LSILSNDPLTQLAFSVYENKGVFALLVGSGLSRAAQIPTGWEITIDLIRRIALAQGVKEQTDWAEWYRSEAGEEPNYSRLLEEVASSPEERRSILHSYIEPNERDREEGRKIPTAAHHAIADLVRSGHIRVIVTTNFDRLMENALREHGVEPTVVASVDALAGAEPLTHSACYLLKLHGDYKDARILNTDEELSGYPAQFDGLLDRVFDEHGLIVCGWSGEWDHALRTAFLRAPNRRYPVYWTARGTVASGAQALVDHRRARVISISDADTFFTGLRERVDTLTQSQRQNPLSTELLVNSAKRYLAKPEHRIQLDELFSEETQRLLAKLDGGEFSPNGPRSQGEFRKRVRTYETVTEPLARMAGVLGRWGGDDHLALVLNIVRSLYVNADKVGGGLTVYLNIRSYPALLIFTAFALGLTRAERWSLLHRLFSSTIERQHKESARTIETLFLWAWSGTEEDAWKQIEGMDKRKTPLSDHLLTIFEEWGQSVVGLIPDFERLFERFEMLGSLAYLEQNDKDTLKAALNGNPQQAFAWMPVGRAGWHTSNAQKIISEMQSEAPKKLYSAPDSRKAIRKFLELFVTNFSRVAGRMRW
jgi:hypothetical protein